MSTLKTKLSADISFVFPNTLKANTAKIAPADAIPTSPNASRSEAAESFFISETPADKARIKGTVIAPVVVPEESKAIEINSEDEKRESKNITP